MAREKKMLFVYVFFGVALIALGIFMLVREDLFKQIIIIALGLSALMSSIVSLVTLKRYQFSKFSFSSTLFKGITGIIIGVLAIVLPIVASMSVWNVLMYILASQFVIASFVLFSDALFLRKTEFAAKPLAIEGTVSLVFAILLFVFPTEAANLFIMLLAIIVIVVGITFILLGYFYAKRAKRVDITIEGEVE
ncbi:MAG: hypothetical protein EOM67_05860 [Spirochaetia bacterium]|nr:hypothetical protein [Spirochaetia bacterium]